MPCAKTSPAAGTAASSTADAPPAPEAGHASGVRQTGSAPKQRATSLTEGLQQTEVFVRDRAPKERLLA